MSSKDEHQEIEDMKKASFIGHRDIIGIESEIYSEILKMKAAGIEEFYSGGMGNFDKMCECAVRKAGGKLIYVPYNKSRIKPADFEWYDEIICPIEGDRYSKYDIPERNNWLVRNCDVFLCYIYRNGGAMKTYNKAKNHNKILINLYECR